jgi:cytochrome oxidase assembly protein ShyY1
MRRYRFDWRLSLLTALLLPLMVSLGFWQLRRGDEKAALQSLYDARQQAAAVPLASLAADGDVQYRQVSISGRYDNEHVFLLDNRIYQGKPGYEAIVPVIGDDGSVTLVNRGWIAQGASRQALPTVTSIEGDVSITGSVYQQVGTPVTLGAQQDTTGWPRVVETLDVMQMAALAGHAGAAKVFPHTVRIAQGVSGALVRYWPVVSMTPERHYGYAVQWFAMATALVLLYLFYSTKNEITNDK